MPDFGTRFRPDLLKGFKFACNRVLRYYIRILSFYKFYTKIKRFKVVFWGYWRISRTIIRARVCVYYIGTGSRAAAVWRDFSELLNISRFALNFAGFIHHIIVLNTNFVPRKVTEILKF